MEERENTRLLLEGAENNVALEEVPNDIHLDAEVPNVVDAHVDEGGDPKLLHCG